MTNEAEEMAVTFENSPSKDDLQLQLRNTEVLLKLKSLKFLDTGAGKFTKGVFVVIPADPVPPQLRLELDPTGALAPKANEELVCRGTASIQLTSTKVAAFRAKT